MNDITNLLNTAMRTDVFPLYTVSALAQRWNLSVQAVSNRTRKDEHFPKAFNVEGIFEGMGYPLFPHYEVIAYETLRSLGAAANQQHEEMSAESIAANTAMSKADRIRKLTKLKLTRREIADLMDIRVQHVRNVQVRSDVEAMLERPRKSAELEE